MGKNSLLHEILNDNGFSGVGATQTNASIETAAVLAAAIPLTKTPGSSIVHPTNKMAVQHSIRCTGQMANENSFLFRKAEAGRREHK
jgi:hypothetical protein